MARKHSDSMSQVVKDAQRACADEATAVAFLEQRRWGDCPACVHCGDTDVYMMMQRKTGERDKRFRWRCRGCGQQYTVRVGTVMESSNIPLRHWALASWLIASGKKGFSAKQLQRMTGISYKSCLFLLHRIRYAMADECPPLLSGTVEVDETYVGGKPRASEKKKGKVYKRGRGTDKQPVVAVVERGGAVRASPVVSVTGAVLEEALKQAVHPSACIVSDELNVYPSAAKDFTGGHKTVAHGADEYVRYEEDGFAVHTNTAEGFFSLFKRGLNGIYHSVSRRHLHRYCSEFAFRYSARYLNDGERLSLLIRSTEGKRLANHKSAAL